MTERENLEYDGYTVYCPICGIGIDIEDGTARCDYCDWFATDTELIEIMIGGEHYA